MSRALIAYCDGAIETRALKSLGGEPRKLPAWGFVLYELPADNPALEVLVKHWGLCDVRGPVSNNVAEYQAVKECLAWVVDHEPRDLFGLTLTVRGDSRLWVEQLSGRTSVRGGAYEDVAAVARTLRDLLRGRGARVRFEWVPRAENAEADHLSRMPYRESV